MSIRIRDLTIHQGLVVVTVEGFEPARDYAIDEGVRYEVPPPIDPPGSANYLCSAYGMAGEDEDEGTHGTGILWTDYDLPDWLFSVLLDANEAATFAATAAEEGYYVVSVKEIEEPDNYGDGMSGTVALVKHREGWILLEN